MIHARYLKDDADRLLHLVRNAACICGIETYRSACTKMMAGVYWSDLSREGIVRIQASARGYILRRQYVSNVGNDNKAAVDTCLVTYQTEKIPNLQR